MLASLFGRSPSIKAEVVTELAREAIEVEEEDNWKEVVYDLIRGIRDPEKPDSTLEDLGVVREDLVRVCRTGGDFGFSSASVGFVPTVPHCSLATLIGLCLRVKLERGLPERSFKVDLYLLPGSHQSAEEITKQINDKERVAAAMENPSLLSTVEECIRDRDC